MLHGAIIAACMIALAFPYLHLSDLCQFIAFVAVSHVIQDWIKIRLVKDSKETLTSFFMDQAIHIGILSLLFLTNIKYIGPYADGRQKSGIGPSYIDYWNNDAVIIYCIIAIAAGFMGHYAIMLHKNYSGSGIVEKWYGIVERILIVSLFLGGPVFLFGIPIILIGRLSLYGPLKGPCALTENFISPSTLILTSSVACIAGFVLTYSI